MQPRGRRTPSLGLILLFVELYQTSTRYGLPPVTLASIIGQIIIYLGLVPLPWISSQACVSVHKIFYLNDYWKLLIAQVEHGDDWHLYYNMVSFMWKGKTLENRMGSTKYALLLLMFTAATGITYVGLNYALAEFMQDYSYMYRCAVGFSGVIFALKVLTTHYGSDLEHRSFGPFGIPVSSKYAVWVELVLISLISPNASFVGHLAGILVGLAYVYGPLKPILDFIHDIIFNGGRNSSTYFGPRRTGRGQFTATSQSTGYGHDTRTPGVRRSTSTYAPPGMSEEEQLRRATEESLQENYGWRTPTAPPLPDTNSSPAQSPTRGYSTQPTADELRRIRLQRFN